MYMLGVVLMSLLNKVTYLISNAKALIQQLLSNFIGALTWVKTRYAVNLTWFLLAQTEQNTSRLHVLLITVGQSIKAVLILVQSKAIQIGSQLQTTVRLMLQRVSQVLLQSKDKLVAYIKLVQLRFSVTTFAQTPMVVQLIQGGEKLLGTVRQLPLHAKALLKVKR